MAARLDRRHSELSKSRIKTTLLLERVQSHAFGEVEMTPSQLQAAFGLLDRTVPKLSTIQHVGDEEGGPIKHNHTVSFIGASTATQEA